MVTLLVGSSGAAGATDPCTDAGGTPGTTGTPGQVTCTFSTPNSTATPSYTFVVPVGATGVSLQAQGGQGGLAGGKGADVTAAFSGLAGSALTIVVGAKGEDSCPASPPSGDPCGGGYPDGGPGGLSSATFFGGGGGSSRISSAGLLVVAGAGGGTSSSSGGGAGGNAAVKGDDGTGITNATGGLGGGGATGGTPGLGGAAGTGTCNGSPGTDGTGAGQGGSGGSNVANSSTANPAGGGGGGYAGGGGGGGPGGSGSMGFCQSAGGGGGGGGSSFVDSSATSSTISEGVNAGGIGDGQVVITYTPLLYTFTGFFNPVANPPVINVVKAGSGVAIKFSLSGDQGLDIFDAGFPASVALDPSCLTGGAVPEATSPAGKSGLSYNPTTDTYSYNWKTKKTWKGTCRQFDLGLNDDSDHVAFFKFK